MRGLFWSFVLFGFSIVLYRIRCFRRGFWKEFWGGLGRRDRAFVWFVGVLVVVWFELRFTVLLSFI